MTRDYWLYQEREVKEPFALHVWVIDKHHADFCFYAEYLPAKSRKYLYVDIKHNDFIGILEAFAKTAGIELESNDYDQMTELYLSIKQDLHIMKG